MKRHLNEQTAAEQAHALGLTYSGFGGWCGPDRKVVARTVDGVLVKVDGDEDQQQEQHLGSLYVLSFEDTILQTDTANPSKYIAKFNTMIKAIIRKPGDFVLLVKRGTEHAVASYLAHAGVKAGVKLVPIGDLNPNKARDFVKEKIEQGYRNIQYFDTNENNCRAVEGLQATYNKLQDFSLDVHPLTRMDSAKPLETQNDS